MTAPRGGVAVVALAVALAGCGGSATEEVAETPVVQAEPVPFDGTGLAAPSEDAPPAADEAAPAEEPPSPAPEEPAPSPTASRTVGPSSADAAAFVRSDALADLSGIEHVVVDLDADTWPEVVATGVRDRAGVLRVAWWTADGYVVLAEDLAGLGRDVSDLRAADVNADGRTELLVAMEGDGLGSLALWRVPRRGVLERLAAEGGCHDGSHVYGVTRARLQSGGDGPAAIVADCDESPLPVADWGEQRWVWEAGAYRVVTPPPDHAKDDDEPDDASVDDPPNGEGNGNGVGNGGNDD